ncbi:MAG: hypothetical protein WC141_00585 [Arcobacteraceae bacterium]
MKYFLLIIFLLALSGCSFKEVKPTSHYTLEVKKSLPVYETQAKNILITKPILNAPYNSKNIFFTQKPYVFEQYAVNKWIELPQLMIENMLYETLQNSYLFENVALENSKTTSDYTLQSHVTKLFHAYKASHSFALVSIKFTLSNKNKTLDIFYAKKEILCEENTPYGFVKASNKAFEEISIELLEHLEKSSLLK